MVEVRLEVEVDVGRVEVGVEVAPPTPMQTGRSCVPVRPANKPVSQLLPTQGFQVVRSDVLMLASAATSAQVVSV